MRPDVARTLHPGPGLRPGRRARVRAGLRAALAVALAGLAAAGCTELSPLGPGGSERVLVTDARDKLRQKVDLLFVVDNTATMAKNQELLTTSFTILTQQLRYLDGQLPDLHIGVVSSDMGASELYPVDGCGALGDAGKMQTAPRMEACSVPTDAFLDFATDRIDGSALQNFDGALEQAFACIAQLGNTGCRYEQPLAAMERALDGSVALNDGFLRDDAVLAVVFLTDEDDCSIEDEGFFAPTHESGDPLWGLPVDKFRCFRTGVECRGDDVFIGSRQGCIPNEDSPYLVSVDDHAAFLRGLKRDERDLVVTAITGISATVEVERVELDDSFTLKPTCIAPGGPAYPAVRLQSLASAFPDSGQAASLCDAAKPDFNILTSTGKAIHDALGNFCLAGHLVDVSTQAGIQPDCLVTQVPVSGESILMPACEDSIHPEQSTVTPCYAIKTGAHDCHEYPHQLGLQVNWGPTGAPPPGYRTEVRCLIEDPELPLGRP